MISDSEEKEVFDRSRYQTPDFDAKYGKILKQLDNVLAVLHEGICISNAEGVILKMNPMYEKLSGLPPEALLGKSVSYLNSKKGVFEQPDCDAELSEKQNGICRGPVSPIVLKRKKPSSTIQKTRGGNANLLHGYPLFNDDGEVELVITFIRDISQLAVYKAHQMAYHQDLYHSYRSPITELDSCQPLAADFVCESPQMKKLLEQVKKIASTDATVLVLGETGVGKGEIARLIHGLSSRANQTFFKADCTCVPENLIESEFFGYAKGAFSGASATGKPGYFSAANHGTIFLDEIGEFPLSMQAKLLRVLQDQEVMQLGSVTPVKVDVRVVAATNVNLEEAVEDGTFRRDLFYRLNISVLRIPSLKERKEDILPLANNFIARYNAKYKKKVSFSFEAQELLLKHSWPGNVRELRNMVQGLVINCETDTILPEELPLALQRVKQTPSVSCFVGKGLEGKSLKEIMVKVEQNILQKAMDEYGSMTKVAKMFGIDRTTVSRKLSR